MSDTDIHQFQSGEFPKMKAPMDVNDHPDDHNPETEYEDGQGLGHTFSSDRLSTETGTGNAMIRDRAVNSYNAKKYGQPK